jgi:hypothetical protein
MIEVLDLVPITARQQDTVSQRPSATNFKR